MMQKKQTFFLMLFILLIFTIYNTGAHNDTVQTRELSDSTEAYHDSFSMENKKLTNKPVKEISGSLLSADTLFDHIHNKIVHFPVALTFAAFLFTLLAYRWKNLDMTIIILVGMAALGGTLAYFTGIVQEEAMTDFSKEWILEEHEQWGTVITFMLWVWLIFLLAKPLKRYSIIIAAIVLIIMLYTAHAGGALAH